MTFSTLKSLCRGLACVAVLAMAQAPSMAQEFPQRPLKLVVPSGPGSGTDILARLFAERLSTHLGQPVVVENKAGAGGNIAHDLVATAAADGYTLAVSHTGPMAIHASLYKKLNFDPVKDFTPVTMLGFTTNVLVVKGDSPHRTVADFVQYARQNAGKATYASAGNGSSGHLASELFRSMSNAQMLNVPFKEGTQAITSVMTGETDFIFYLPSVLLPQIQAGKLRALAVSSKRASVLFPGVLPLAEQGYPGFDLTGWWSVTAPSKVPAPVLNRLVQASDKVVRSPEFQERMLRLGIEPSPMTPAEIVQFFASETEKWSKVVRLSGATAN